MSLRRCFSSLGCADFSLDATIALAQAHDIPCIELRALGGTVDLVEYFRTQFHSPDKLARQLSAASVAVVSLNASWRLVGGTAAEREQLLALAPWADAAGVPRLRVFDGGKEANDAELAEAGEALRWWQSARHQHRWRVDVMVETHDSLFTGDALRRFGTKQPSVALLWDVHHTWRKGAEDPAVTWPAIRGRVVHVHVKDSIAVPSARHPFTYVRPGDGEFPAEKVFTALRRDRFGGPVSLEWERMWHPYLPPLEDALRTAAQRHWW